MDTRSKIIDLDRATLLAADLRSGGKRLVVAGGAFDVLQSTHARFLATLRADGAVVLAAVYDDASDAVLPASARAQVVAALAAVDYVVICAESELDALARQLGVDRLERVPAGRNIIGEILKRHK